MNLIPKIRTFKYGDFHLDLSAELKAVQADVVAKAIETNSAVELPPPPPARTLEQAANSPLASLIYSFNEVEAALNDVAKKHQIDTKSEFETHRHIMRALLEKGLVDDLTFSTYARLAELRKAVNMSQEVTYTDAVNMSVMCKWLIEKLSTI
ncbi:Hypothetical protein PSEBR_a1312 [Pseudomonas brassicacearum subsp. brassicacearum NFM421]|uniref:Uncharacterized protein n=2 Tax=Pseudomonas brassicacearum TaxID=930166 RepID=F2KE23_PSEBN|nr:Hypothetical protein PSEBR_a1312 [Pseudomonas brassicacearum subsp. brassicacearum NFM421]